MKSNFKCPKCKKKVAVGKRLHASYTCPCCKYQMLITRKEREQGHVNYKRNFFSAR